MTAPRVSVIIPTYNRARLVAESVRSVLDQSYRDLEVIVVDDGSTDGTAGELARLFGGRIRVCVQPNGGNAAARNRGLAEARGELLAFNDSDDLWLPGKLERQVAYLDAHPEVDLVCGNGIDPARGEGRRGLVIPYARGRRLEARGPSLRDMIERSFSRTPTLVARRRLFERVGPFDAAFRACVDSEFMSRALLAAKVAFINEPLFVLGRHESHVGGDLENRSRHDIMALEKLVRAHPEAVEIVGRRVWTARLAYRHYRLARACERKGRLEEAAAEFRRSAAIRPLTVRSWIGWARVRVRLAGGRGERPGEEQR